MNCWSPWLLLMVHLICLDSPRHRKVVTRCVRQECVSLCKTSTSEGGVSPQALYCGIIRENEDKGVGESLVVLKPAQVSCKGTVSNGSHTIHIHGQSELITALHRGLPAPLSVVIQLLSPHIIPAEALSCVGPQMAPPLFLEQMLKKTVPPNNPPTSNRRFHCAPSLHHLIRPPAQRFPDVSVLPASFDYTLSTLMLASWLRGGNVDYRRWRVSCWSLTLQ